MPPLKMFFPLSFPFAPPPKKKCGWLRARRIRDKGPFQRGDGFEQSSYRLKSFQYFLTIQTIQFSFLFLFTFVYYLYDAIKLCS